MTHKKEKSQEISYHQNPGSSIGSGFGSASGSAIRKNAESGSAFNQCGSATLEYTVLYIRSCEEQV
jgi:hypothetical protein